MIDIAIRMLIEIRDDIIPAQLKKFFNRDDADGKIEILPRSVIIIPEASVTLPYHLAVPLKSKTDNSIQVCPLDRIIKMPVGTRSMKATLLRFKPEKPRLEVATGGFFGNSVLGLGTSREYGKPRFGSTQIGLSASTFFQINCLVGQCYRYALLNISN